jgi:hypothetical protein
MNHECKHPLQNKTSKMESQNMSGPDYYLNHSIIDSRAPNEANI